MRFQGRDLGVQSGLTLPDRRQINFPLGLLVQLLLNLLLLLARIAEGFEGLGQLRLIGLDCPQAAMLGFDLGNGVLPLLHFGGQCLGFGLGLLTLLLAVGQGRHQRTQLQVLFVGGLVGGLLLLLALNQERQIGRFGQFGFEVRQFGLQGAEVGGLDGTETGVFLLQKSLAGKRIAQALALLFEGFEIDRLSLIQLRDRDL